MRTITFFQVCLVLGIVSNFSYAQVGIGTTTPNGILDISSNNYGVVYPCVPLTTTNNPSPVINPRGAGLAIGTTVYNTNATYTGSNDVAPGIYSWDGSKWVTHFFKRQSELFEQKGSVRTASTGGFAYILGLAPGDNTFTAKYSGLYKIEVKVNYGGGDMIDNGDVNVAQAEGDFKFTFDETDHIINIKSFSVYNDHIGSGTNYSNAWVETFKTIYINLTAGQTYNMSLAFDQYPVNGFVSSGDSGTGMGYIGTDIPCFIEFTYIDE